MIYYSKRKKRKKLILRLSLLIILGFSLCLSIINFQPPQQDITYQIDLKQAKICLPKAKNSHGSY